MTLSITIAILMTIVIASTPILLAALGELIVEKSGVLNLGIEGMMLIGAVCGFAAATLTGSLTLGFLAAIIAGMLASLIFAFLTLTLSANQVATGLALTIFGTGLSALIGTGFVGKTIQRVPNIFPDSLANHALYRVVFGYDIVVYLALALTITIAWFLKSTRAGLILKAVGESDTSAHAIGFKVLRIRTYAILFGGAMAGLAGAYFSLGLTPLWSEKLTAGRGWIALALVVFAAWKPYRLLLGAYIFGGVMTLELHAKAAGLPLASEFIASLPYIATIIVLTVISIRSKQKGSDVPACLGKPFST
jgi:general nucleoside transport system permease protein